MTLIAAVGMFFVTLSMAEMASCAPTAYAKQLTSLDIQTDIEIVAANITGVQSVSPSQINASSYVNVASVAPKRYQKFISYFVGFFCVLGWQAGLAGVIFGAAQQVDAIVILAYPEQKFEGWQTALISWAVLALAIVCNTVLFRKLPMIEGLLVTLHFLGFFAFLIVLWVMAPRGNAKNVFTSFQTNGWSSSGLACLVGFNGALGNVIGADSSVHLAEELQNASWVLPRSMLAGALANYAVAVIMVITLAFCLGNYDSVLGSDTGQPYVAIVLNATQSHSGTIVLTLVVLIMIMASAVNSLATISRQLWSFSRDGAVPFSAWLSRVEPTLQIPINAVIISVCFSIALTAISIGSSTAYGVFVSLGLSGLLTSYWICIACEHLTLLIRFGLD